MARLYDKKVAPAPTERAVLLRRQPRPMEIVRWMERELVVSEGDLAGQGFVVRDSSASSSGDSCATPRAR